MRDAPTGISTTSGTAVILAGGQGTRLRPYTVTLPKPLVPVGERPILEILLGQLVRDGFARVIIAVGHLSGLIEAYCGDGSRWGITIEYACEDEPLGTAAPLAVLRDRLPESFLVLNGDVLCDLKFAEFLSEHRQHPDEPLLTISTHQRTLRSEYGVLDADRRGHLKSYCEKPTYDLAVSEGVYAISHQALQWIPRGAPLDFPQFVNTLLDNQQTIIAREHNGLWLDIGRPEDYEQAQTLVTDHPDLFPVIPPARTTAGARDALQSPA